MCLGINDQAISHSGQCIVLVALKDAEVSYDFWVISTVLCTFMVENCNSAFTSAKDLVEVCSADDGNESVFVAAAAS
jgi:hypothetical protein